MILSIIGTSGIGKTHNSRLLDQNLYSVYHCDDYIYDRVSSLFLTSHTRDEHDIGSWLGFPSEHDYRSKRNAYISIETEVMSNLLNKASNEAKNKDVVLDCSGSVIYIDPKLLESMQSVSTVIYLEASKNYINAMCEQYVANPKALIWDESFQPNDHEGAHETIRRCFKTLIDNRQRKYLSLSDYKIEFETARSGSFSFPEFVRTIIQSKITTTTPPTPCGGVS